MAHDGAILVCTVGGSLPPILKALGAGRWQRVVFVCTRDAEGVVGSAEMVERAADGGPPIPQRAGLGADCWEIVDVPPDDPDAAFAILGRTLRALQRRQPPVPIVADFNGGTKSMSAALTLAALDCNVPLQLVTGRRADLVKVLDRSERAVAVHTERIAAARAFERLAAGWGRFAYREAADGFDELREDLKRAGLSRDELGRFNRAQELSAAFAAWDCFDHKKAAGCLNKKLYREVEIGGRTDCPNWPRHWRAARTHRGVPCICATSGTMHSAAPRAAATTTPLPASTACGRPWRSGCCGATAASTRR
jgi:hypothetical protein